MSVQQMIVLDGSFWTMVSHRYERGNLLIDSYSEFDTMRNALWTDPSDQSLWFYYQFLMTTLTEIKGYSIIVPNFSQDDRLEYITQQLVDLRDMLDGAEDCKWIYNALLQYTLSACELNKREPNENEKKDLQLWLAQLRKLDPLRAGRWDDLEDM
jgi:geranylgeranyl transferase type-2 subunit alpha